MSVEEDHAFSRQGSGMFHLPVGLVRSILSVKSSVGLERAVHIRDRYREHLETERDSFVSAHMGYHGTEVASCRGTAD